MFFWESKSHPGGCRRLQAETRPRNKPQTQNVAQKPHQTLLFWKYPLIHQFQHCPHPQHPSERGTRSQGDPEQDFFLGKPNPPGQEGENQQRASGMTNSLKSKALSKGMEFQPSRLPHPGALELDDAGGSCGIPEEQPGAFLIISLIFFFLKAESELCVFGFFHALNTAGGSSSLRPRAASEGGSRSMQRFWGQTLHIWGFRGKI